MDSYQRCDESKCVSKGRSNLFNDSFTCYGDNGTFWPKMCADGFLPVVVDDEPLYDATPWDKDADYTVLDYDKNITVEYFTCCPPDIALERNEETTNVTRRCSDPIAVDDDGDKSAYCANQDYGKYPVLMNSAGIWSDIFGLYRINSYEKDVILCCESSNQTETENFLAETECVPYINDFYEAGNIDSNELHFIDRIHCVAHGGDFSIPRPLVEGGSIDDVAASRAYQCCRNGTPLPPYVQDTTYWIGSIILTFVFVLAILASVTTILGLSIPLLIQLKNKSFQGAVTSGRSNSSRRSSPTYSTYNLYLVYLAIPDLMNSLWAIIYRFVHTTSNPSTRNFMYAISQASVIANLWLNAIVLYQIMLLLQSFQKAQRVNQPSIRRVTLQTLAAFSLAITMGVVQYFGALKSTNMTLGMVTMLLVYLALFLPIVYGIYVTIHVYRTGYLRVLRETATASEKAKRQLAVYFFRVVAIFVGMWLPTTLFGVIVMFFVPSLFSAFAFLLQLVTGIQPIATFCLVVTKPDCKEYCRDLVTMSYCRRGSNSEQQRPTIDFRSRSSAIFNTSQILTAEFFKRRSSRDVLQSSIRDASTRDVQSGA